MTRITYPAQIRKFQGGLLVTLKDTSYWWGDVQFTAGVDAGRITITLPDDPLDSVFKQTASDAFLSYSGTAAGDIAERRIAATLDGIIYVRHLRQADGIIAQFRPADHRLEFVR